MQQHYGLQERQNVSLVLPSSGHAEPDVSSEILSLSCHSEETCNSGLTGWR